MSSQEAEEPNASVTAVTAALESLAVAPQAQATPFQLLRIYTPAQLLQLHKSPLVQPPPNMPDLKDWFGAENEVNLHKRDGEPSTPNSARERRFRRDQEDSEPPSRTFRSAAAQPSQMGNFKHPSSRTDRDREGEKDVREKDGERLRNLSDKFDRERLTLPLSAGLRNKDRDPAPHLAAGTSSRLDQQPPNSAPASRRAENRDSSRRAGDDWRRMESRRTVRDDRGRGDRERARSRGRDSSQSRRDRSSSRPGDRDRRGNAEDNRRERESNRNRRDKDSEKVDRGDDQDDPRHWRDDGRRDERIAARRLREKQAATSQDSPSDSRVEDRDAKGRRNAAREKRTAEDTKDRDDRRSEREKEKEPAWMDTYIPSPSSAGILGGKADDGELDGIQLWKMGLKEKEKKANPVPPPESNTETANPAPTNDPSSGAQPLMDEIQLFKLLMKREQQREEVKLTNTNSQSNFPGGNNILPGLLKNYGPETTSTPSPGVLAERDHLASGPSSLVSASDTGINNENIITDMRHVSPSPTALAKEPSYLHSTAAVSAMNPPSGSRLLALGTRHLSKSSPQPASPHVDTSPILTTTPHLTNGSTTTLPGDAERTVLTFNDYPQVLEERGPAPSVPRMDGGYDSTVPGYPNGRGSRFAKFFDNKRENPATSLAPNNILPVSSHVAGFQDLASVQQPISNPHAMDDIFAMLHSSTQRSQVLSHPPNSAPLTSPHSPLTHRSQIQQIQPSQLPFSNRMEEALYDSRVESRNFVPDGMVPGLRSAPPPRSRESYPEHPDDALAIKTSRLAATRQLDSHPYILSQANVFAPRPSGLPPQTIYRGGSSPIPNPNLLPVQQVQRLPHGLANLGGRPPHEPSQFIGMHGQPQGSMNQALRPNNPQQSFNNPGFNGRISQPLLGGGAPQQLHSSLTHQQLANLGLPSTVDQRNVNQLHLLGLGNAERGLGAFGGQGSFGQNITGQLPPIRQQLPSHHQLLPAHLQQQMPPITTNQTHELMNLLMGGQARE